MMHSVFHNMQRLSASSSLMRDLRLLYRCLRSLAFLEEKTESLGEGGDMPAT